MSGVVWDRNNGNQIPSLLPDDDRDPFLSLRRGANRLFDDVFRGTDHAIRKLWHGVFKAAIS